MHFIYDVAYGDVVYGSVKGLTPYYRQLNTLFRFTLTPRGGDSDNISHRAKNLLVHMAPRKPKFAVMEFFFGMRCLDALMTPLVLVTLRRISFI